MLISIIIPCHNVDDYIVECVVSAFNQTFKNIEVICIDNNSSDQTLAKLEKLRTTYPFLVIDREFKPGASAARNKGLTLAKGGWIQFLDADDLLLPSKIEHQVSLIDDSFSFIVGACIYKSKYSENKFIPNKNANIWENLAKVHLGNTCCNLFSKKWLIEVSGWNEELKSSQEYDLMFRILKKNCRVRYDNEALTIINQVENSITRKPENIVNNIVRRAKLLNQILEFTKKSSISSSSIKEIEQALFDVVREMYLYDSNESIKMYQGFFNGKYNPIISSATSKKYIYIHRIIGFKFSNLIINKTKRLIKH
ncbi:glycosyltransferase involved in cell wall biosynthesis [Breznakibacter xylanolyticus]|uniref:Glycosyltransferase involved in cell wall biosynthesis n=2 Tax=Breznakibacter xylanolyticus TaxID=990 RepID=A0A2W7N505_9BACT|nr:glycosyltransferase involved in cell wall biosynthesis [Breznakibacter xylanolyticus]